MKYHYFWNVQSTILRFQRRMTGMKNKMLWVIGFSIIFMNTFSFSLKDELYCPLCDMVVDSSFRLDFKGNQTVFACYMAGHLDGLHDHPEKFLKTPVVDSTTYRSDASCPVCGKTSLEYSIPWGPLGNQKLSACSKEHAELLFHQTSHYFASTDEKKENDFCSRNSVMFSGFQSTIGGTCVTLLFPSWILNSGFKYALALVGIFVFAVLLEGMGEWREELKNILFKTFGYYDVTSSSNSFSSYISCTSPQGNDSTMGQLIQCLPVGCRAVLAIAYSVHMALAYLLMLIIMSYESGIFVTVVCGLALGFFIYKDVEEETWVGNPDPCCST